MCDEIGTDKWGIDIFGNIIQFIMRNSQCIIVGIIHRLGNPPSRRMDVRNNQFTMQNSKCVIEVESIRGIVFLVARTYVLAKKEGTRAFRPLQSSFLFQLEYETYCEIK